MRNWTKWSKLTFIADKKMDNQVKKQTEHEKQTKHSLFKNKKGNKIIARPIRKL
ncbi:MAG: hypothetical protein WCC56_13685 [Erwinia sp.]